MSIIRSKKRHRVFERDGMICQYCGILCHPRRRMRPDKATIDHRIPRSQGGSNAMANLVTACWACNNRKGNLPASALFDSPLPPLAQQDER